MVTEKTGHDSEDGESHSSAERRTKKKEVSIPTYGKRVDRLKSIINSCGLSVPPSIYKKVKQVSEDKRKAYLMKELEEIFSREGLSDKEIKEVKKRKERAKEPEGIDMSSIVSSSCRGMASRYVAPPKPEIPAEGNGEEAGDSDADDGRDDDVEDEDEDDDGNDKSQSEDLSEVRVKKFIFPLLSSPTLSRSCSSPTPLVSDSESPHALLRRRRHSPGLRLARHHVALSVTVAHSPLPSLARSSILRKAATPSSPLPPPPTIFSVPLHPLLAVTGKLASTSVGGGNTSDVPPKLIRALRASKVAIPVIKQRVFPVF